MHVRTFLVTASLVSTLFTVYAISQTYTAVAYRYATISYPGAVATTANSINNGNIIVGSYFDSTYSVHGFIYRNGKYTRVDFPGSTETEIHGINDRGDIVGVYQVSGPLNFHGFLRHQGEFTTIDDPEAQFGTTPLGINDNMEIVGTFDDSQAFVLKDGTFRTFTTSLQSGDVIQTQINAINNLGWIAGQVSLAGNWRGFWLIGRDEDFLEPPSASDNQVTGINARGDIVGCHDATSGFVSFRVEADERSERKEPALNQQRLPSCASAINYSRVIVGNYFRVGRTNAFVAVPQLTLNVTGPANHSSITSPVHMVASAAGLYPISQIQVWINSHEDFHVNGSHLNSLINMPTGQNQRLAIQALDLRGIHTKIVMTVAVE